MSFFPLGPLSLYPHEKMQKSVDISFAVATYVTLINDLLICCLLLQLCQLIGYIGRFILNVK